MALTLEDKRARRRESQRRVRERKRAGVVLVRTKQTDEERKAKARAYAARYRAEHANKIRSDQQAWREKNREAARLKAKSWREQNLERGRAANRAWYARHREHAVAFAIQWQRDNPEKVRLRAAAYRARKRAAVGTLSPNIVDVLMIEQGGRCPYCSTTLSRKNRQLDHYIALASGGSNDDDNVQLLCKTCNCSKRNANPVAYARRVFEAML